MECIVGTLSRNVRAAITHADLASTYCKDALHDVVFKYNRALHHTTKQIRYKMGHHAPPKMYNMFSFEKIGSIPLLTDKSAERKLDAWGTLACYLFGIEHNHDMVEAMDAKQHKRVHSVDFHLTNPLLTLFALLAWHSNQITNSSDYSNHELHKLPLSRKQVQQCPGSIEFEAAHNTDIYKLDRLEVIDWVPPDKLPKILIPLNMEYTSKTSLDAQVADHKASLAVRENFMMPHEHFNPDHKSAHFTQNETVHLVLAVAAAKQLYIEHFDLTKTYPQEL